MGFERSPSFPLDILIEIVGPLVAPPREMGNLCDLRGFTLPLVCIVGVTINAELLNEGGSVRDFFS